MEIRELSVPDAFEITPGPARRRPGRVPRVVQGRAVRPRRSGTGSSSSRPTARSARRARCAASTSPTCPPGQAKYVTCRPGAVLDVVVDIRVGSPTFGRWDSVLLDDADRRAVYVGRGPRPRLHGAHRRRRHLLPVLRGLQPRSRARRAPAGPGARHRAGRPTSSRCCRPRTRRRRRSPRRERAGLLPSYDECLAFYERCRRGPDRAKPRRGVSSSLSTWARSIGTWLRTPMLASAASRHRVGGPAVRARRP